MSFCLSFVYHIRARCLNRSTEMPFSRTGTLAGSRTHLTEQRKKKFGGWNLPQSHCQPVNPMLHPENTNMRRLATAIPPFAKLLSFLFKTSAVF